MGGYTNMVANMLKGIDVKLSCDYLENKEDLDKLADKVVYTGPIDAYFNYNLGPLEYRSVRFETEVLDTPNFRAMQPLIIQTEKHHGPVLSNINGSSLGRMQKVMICPKQLSAGNTPQNGKWETNLITLLMTKRMEIFIRNTKHWQIRNLRLSLEDVWVNIGITIWMRSLIVP